MLWRTALARTREEREHERCRKSRTGRGPRTRHGRLRAQHPARRSTQPSGSFQLGYAMSEIFGFDAYSPKEIAARVDTIGVAKTHLPLLSMLMLSVLAGVFIGLGALYFVLVKSDPSLGFASSQILGG